MARIRLNGLEENTGARTVMELVKLKGLNASFLIIEKNCHVIRQTEWESSEIRQDDKIELLSFVGGG